MKNWSQQKTIAPSSPKSHQPSCVVVEDESEFQIVCRVTGPQKSSLCIFLSPDGKRLHMLGRKEQDGSPFEFLWTFQLPRNLNEDDIQIEGHQGIYLVHIPRQKASLPAHPLLTEQIQAS